jgi:hypothetical protein
MYSCQRLWRFCSRFGGAPLCVGGCVRVYICCHTHDKVWLGLPVAVLYPTSCLWCFAVYRSQQCWLLNVGSWRHNCRQAVLLQASRKRQAVGTAGTA